MFPEFELHLNTTGVGFKQVSFAKGVVKRLSSQKFFAFRAIRDTASQQTMSTTSQTDRSPFGLPLGGDSGDGFFLSLAVSQIARFCSCQESESLRA